MTRGLSPRVILEFAILTADHVLCCVLRWVWNSLVELKIAFAHRELEVYVIEPVVLCGKFVCSITSSPKRQFWTLMMVNDQLFPVTPIDVSLALRRMNS